MISPDRNSPEYQRLIDAGKARAMKRNRATPQYQRIRQIVSLAKGQHNSRQVVPCEACGVSDEARLMVWVQDSPDAGPLNNADWRLTLWRMGMPMSFKTFYYCQVCHARFVKD